MVQEIKLKRRYVKSPNWKPRPMCERKVMVYGTVKRMYWEKAQQEVTELLKQYR